MGARMTSHTERAFPKTTEPLRLLTIDQTAERLACSPRTVRYLIDRGPLAEGIAAVRMGRSVRISSLAIEEYIHGLEPVLHPQKPSQQASAEIEVLALPRRRNPRS